MKTGEQSFVFSVDAEWVLKVKADKDDVEDSNWIGDLFPSGLV